MKLSIVFVVLVLQVILITESNGEQSFHPRNLKSRSKDKNHHAVESRQHKVLSNTNRHASQTEHSKSHALQSRHILRLALCNQLCSNVTDDGKSQWSSSNSLNNKTGTQENDNNNKDSLSDVKSHSDNDSDGSSKNDKENDGNTTNSSEKGNNKSGNDNNEPEIEKNDGKGESKQTSDQSDNDTGRSDKENGTGDDKETGKGNSNSTNSSSGWNDNNNLFFAILRLFTNGSNNMMGFNGLGNSDNNNTGAEHYQALLNFLGSDHMNYIRRIFDGISENNGTSGGVNPFNDFLQFIASNYRQGDGDNEIAGNDGEENFLSYLTHLLRDSNGQGGNGGMMPNFWPNLQPREGTYSARNHKVEFHGGNGKHNSRHHEMKQTKKYHEEKSKQHN